MLGEYAQLYPHFFATAATGMKNYLQTNMSYICFVSHTIHTHLFMAKVGLENPHVFCYVVSSAKTLSDLRRLQMQHAPKHHEDQKYRENDPKHLGRWKALVQ